jgi:hypothetical protein
MLKTFAKQDTRHGDMLGKEKMIISTESRPEIGGEVKGVADVVKGFGPVAIRCEFEHEAGHACVTGCDEV